MRCLFRYWRASEKTRFLVVGAFNTGFGYLVFAGLYALLNERLHYLFIALLSHAIAVCIAFNLHRYFVFQSSSPWPSAFLRYNVSLLGVLAFNMGALFLLVSLVGMHPLLAQVVVLSGSVVASYMAHRNFTFPRSKV